MHLLLLIAASALASTPTCSDVVTKPDLTAQCLWVTEYCGGIAALIDYMRILYCSAIPQPITVILLIILLLLGFKALQVTAESYFAPAISTVTRTMKLPHHVAGVTFLALGNGAPDLFAAFAAVTSSSSAIAFGALFGAVLFLCCVVVGIVTLMSKKPFTIRRAPFLRDVIYMCVTIVLVVILLWDGYIHWWESLCVVGLYVAYVAWVAISVRIEKNRRAKKRLLEEDPLLGSVSAAPGDQVPTVVTTLGGRKMAQWPSFFISQEGATEQDDEVEEAEKDVDRYHERDRQEDSADEEGTDAGGDDDDDDNPPSLTWFEELTRLDGEGRWHHRWWLWKISYVVSFPILLLFHLTVPTVGPTSMYVHHRGRVAVGSLMCFPHRGRHAWRSWLNAFRFFSFPFVLTLAFGVIGKPMFFLGVVPIDGWVLSLVLGFALCVYAVLLPGTTWLPRLILQFIMSIAWMYLAANEIVALLNTLGIFGHITQAIMGLTVLAWANSLGDFVADTAMAKAGHPRVGVAACFGGPLLNVLLGVGISCLAYNIIHGPLYVRLELEVPIAGAFVIVAQLVAAIWLALFTGMRFTKPLAWTLMVWYVVFMILALVLRFTVGTIGHKFHNRM